MGGKLATNWPRFVQSNVLAFKFRLLLVSNKVGDPAFHTLCKHWRVLHKRLAGSAASRKHSQPQVEKKVFTLLVWSSRF